MDSPQSSTGLLLADEKALHHESLCSRCEETISGKRRHLSQARMILLFGTMQLFFTMAGFAVFNLFHSSSGGSKLGDLNDYSGFAKYNVTRKEFGIMNAADPSPEADEFWRKTTGTSGIVAVNSQWALDMGYPSSVAHPADENLALYQVNAFHSLHCLYRIRNRLIANVPLDKWPRDDFHTLHCVDHIRKDLMCNSDISLRGSATYVDFGVQSTEGQQCRDLDAINRWVERHAWSGFGGFLKGGLNYDPVKIEAEVHRQKLALEKERHERIPWHKADFTYNNVTGEITLIAS